MYSPLGIEHDIVRDPHALAGAYGAEVPQHRIIGLAERIALHVESLVPQGRARCLDVGCGDMSLAGQVQQRLRRTDWRRVDVRDLSTELAREDGRGERRAHPCGREAFDVALLCDVLHTASDAGRLLGEAARVARHVIVKDDFASEPYSRPMLRLMDFARNDDGPDAPQRCFTPEEFVRLATDRRLAITAIDCVLELSGDRPVTRRAHSQFIAVLARG